MAIRVLVIDDSPMDQELARRALRDVPVPPGPVECVMAANWRDGETELAAGGANLVLLDYNLPGLSGLEILRQLRQRGVETPVIMLTGQQEIDTAVTMLREGARDYVPKSATSGPLLCRTVERVLEQVRLERELADARARLAAYATALEEKVAARTAIVQAQAVEIEELYLRSEEAARLKGEILANVSHELRTPLNVVLGYTDLLQEELAQAGSPQAQDMLRTVRTHADRLDQLVQALLALRAGSGGSAPSVARFSCASCATSCAPRPSDSMPTRGCVAQSARRPGGRRGGDGPREGAHDRVPSGQQRDQVHARGRGGSDAGADAGRRPPARRTRYRHRRACGGARARLRGLPHSTAPPRAGSRASASASAS